MKEFLRCIRHGRSDYVHVCPHIKDGAPYTFIPAGQLPRFSTADHSIAHCKDCAPRNDFPETICLGCFQSRALAGSGSSQRLDLGEDQPAGASGGGKA